MFKLLCFMVLFAYGYTKAVSFKDCGSVGGSINTVVIDPCDTEPCVLHHGKNITMHVNFTAKENSTTAKTVVHGIIGGVPVPFPLPSDSCANNDVSCPVVAGTSVVYTKSVYCRPDYPKVRLVIEVELKDDSGKDLFCFAIPASVDD